MEYLKTPIKVIVLMVGFACREIGKQWHTRNFDKNT